MTDTPPSASPPTKWDAAKTFIGDLARPFAIIGTTFAAGIATVIVANKVASPDAAIFIGAVQTGLAALYGAKAWEAAQGAKQDANVKVAAVQAQATTIPNNPPPGQAPPPPEGGGQ